MPHLNKQDKIQEQMDRQFSDDTNREWEEKIREEFQQFIEGGIWQGEDEYTKNFTVGNVADWWLNKLQEELTREREKAFREGYEQAFERLTQMTREIVKEIGNKD